MIIIIIIFTATLIFYLLNGLLLRGEDGECEPTASKEDKDVALPFSDLGLLLGSWMCNPALGYNKMSKGVMKKTVK